jgi:hypothetical protein
MLTDGSWAGILINQWKLFDQPMEASALLSPMGAALLF